MKVKLIVLSLIISFYTSLAFAANPVLHYAPEVVTLTGIMKIKTFPGAPDYESVEAGDDLERCPYLLLSHPIDVITSPEDEDHDAETEKNLKIIQIATGDDSNWNDKYIGKQVLVTGTLFHYLTAHHRTRVLISANHFAMTK